MILECGFLNKSSGYYYYVQNVILSKTGWTKVVINKDNKIIEVTTLCSENKEYKFQMARDNNYNIVLKVNDIDIITSSTLFKVDINVCDTDDTFSYKFEEDIIVDH